MSHPFDCRHFRGDKPCAFSNGQLCPCLLTEERPPAPEAGERPCPHYASLGRKILIIKLGALGDVLRTTTLLPGLARRFPEHSIFWITLPAALPLLEGLELQACLPWSVDAALLAEAISWDLVICLDKEPGPTALASRVPAAEKHGFGRNGNGLLAPLSQSTGELFALGIDDDFKYRRNQKTYPQLIAEACGLDWGPNPYAVRLSAPEEEWAREMSRSWGGEARNAPRRIPHGKRKFVGLNIGSGEAFAGKKWPLERFLDLAARLHADGAVPVFLGGDKERELYERLQNRSDVPGVFPGCGFTLRQFLALVSRLDVVVSGDSLAMHIAIALGAYAVTLFGSTTEREIEFYGRGEALVGRVPCGPCYRRTCPTGEECLRAITVDQVHAAVRRGLETKA